MRSPESSQGNRALSLLPQTQPRTGKATEEISAALIQSATAEAVNAIKGSCAIVWAMLQDATLAASACSARQRLGAQGATFE